MEDTSLKFTGSSQQRGLHRVPVKMMQQGREVED
jgi:hypothetical protein